MPSREIQGVVQAVDPINRQVQVVVNGRRETVDVPPDCTVLLRGERVKLRLMQPWDRLRLRIRDLSGTLVAQAIEVRADSRQAGF